MRYPLSQPIGIQETSPSGLVPLGYYDEGVNVRDFDDRGQRMRPAQRSGMLPLGTPCSNGTPVTHSFTAKIPVARFEFVELDTVATADTTPSVLEEKWSTDLPGEPIAQGRTPSGILIVLTAAGSVYEIRDGGGLTRLFSVEVPIGYTLVPSLAVDGNDGLHVAVSYPRKIDGYATLFYKYLEDEFGEWTLTVTSQVEYVVERFWYDSGDIFCASRQPEDEADGYGYGVSRQGGALTGQLSETWLQEAADPVSVMAFRGGDVYWSAPAVVGRAAATGGGGAEISWTPRELVNANERLYSQHSTLRDRLEFGYSAGTEVRTLHDMRADDSSFATILDTTVRNATVPAYNPFSPPNPFTNIDEFTYPAYVYGADSSPLGAGGELTIAPVALRTENLPLLGVTSWPIPSRAIFQDNTSNDEKAAETDLAPWARGLTPGMGAAFPATSAKFAMALCARLENYAQDLSGATPASPGFFAPLDYGNIALTDWKVVWQHGAYCVRYRGITTGANTDASRDIQIAVDIPGLPTVVSASYDDGSNAIFSIVLYSAGYGNAGSYFRINGVNIGSTFTLTVPPVIGASSLGGISNISEYQGPTTNWPAQMRGGFKEYCLWLGDTTTTPHDTLITTDEVERVEAYQLWAYGAQTRLPMGHNWYAGAPTGVGDTFSPGLSLNYSNERGMTAKLERADGRARWVHLSDASGNGLAVDPDEDSEAVFTAGSPLDMTDVAPDRLERLDDGGTSVTSIWTSDLGAGFGYELTFRDDSAALYVDRDGDVYLPLSTGRTTVRNEIQKRRASDGAELWTGQLAIADGPTALFPSALFIDDSYKAGATVDYFLYVVCRNGQSVKRVDLAGRRDTGETRAQITDQVATCESGVVARLDEGAVDWTELASDFAPGGRPWSFELFGQHFFGGPEDYRVYDASRKILRNWTPGDGSLIPGRIFIAERWRGRAIVVSEDNRNVLYGSAYGDAFDFRTGGDTITATQAFAGTTAAAGAIPDPVSALVVANDDLMYVGTNRSVWRLTGDPQTGGQLDDVLASEGILGPYSHTRGDSGELYWLTTSLRVVQVSGSGMADISSDSIRGRLQQIDRDRYRVEMTYSVREQGLYLLFFPRDGFEEGLTHLFWSRRTGKWHPVTFSGGIGRALSSAGVLENADSGGWGALWGFADGGLRFTHPEALDDDGELIASRMRLPVGGDGDAVQSLITRFEIVLAPDQGPVRVAGVAGRTGQTGDCYGSEKLAVPGRGNLLQLQTAGHNTWVEIIGTGQPWAVDAMAVHAHPWRMG